jgi:ribosomal-protein-alanine N-acetyltransferase
MHIEGEREIHLTTWNESHFHQLYSIANNPKIAMNLRDSYPQPYTIHDARHWIEHNQKFNPAQNFAIEFEGRLVGAIGAERGKDELRTNMELGFWVGEPYWGKGIATEAVKLYTKYIFEKFDIHRIYAQVFDFNGESMSVLEKAGYIPEAILKGGFIKRGTVGDLFQYVMVRGEE